MWRFIARISTFARVMLAFVVLVVVNSLSVCVITKGELEQNNRTSYLAN